MAAPSTATRGDTLRRVADRLLDLADRLDTEQRSLSRVERLHDEIEEAANDVRAIVRGPARQIRAPLHMQVDPTGRSRAVW